MVGDPFFWYAARAEVRVGFALGRNMERPDPGMAGKTVGEHIERREKS